MKFQKNYAVRTIFFIAALGLLSCAVKPEPVTVTGVPQVAAPVRALPPAPNATYDNANQGIYKGVLTGSTGNFWLNINNDNTNAITLSFEFDGVMMNVDGTETLVTPDYEYNFSYNGYTASFLISSTGVVISATFTAPNHPGTISVDCAKATSTNDVTAYEGSFTGTAFGNNASGVWNFVISGTNVTGTAIDTVSGWSSSISGIVSLDSISATVFGGTATGNISGSNASGTWTDGSGGSVTWSGSQSF